MFTITDRVAQRLAHSPYLRDALARGLVNMSALARELQPDIAKDLKKPVSEPAVLMALKRLSDSLTSVTSQHAHQHFGELSLRSDLTQLTVTNSERLGPTMAEILTWTRKDQSSFFIFARGSYETSMVFSLGLRSVVESWMAHERVTQGREDLTAITLQRRNRQPGESNMLHVPLQILAWEGIDVLDVISSSSEITMLIPTGDTERVVPALRSVLQQS
jgi:aspartokinase